MQGGIKTEIGFACGFMFNDLLLKLTSATRQIEAFHEAVRAILVLGRRTYCRKNNQMSFYFLTLFRKKP